MPAVAEPVLLELPGLAPGLPLRVHLCADGTRLPGVCVCGRVEASAARHPAAHAVPGAAGLPQGEHLQKFWSCMGW